MSKINAVIHIDQKATFTASKAHDLRHLDNDSNGASINDDLSQYNQHLLANDMGVQSRDTLLHKQYDDYIQQHDAKQIASRHQSKCFHNLRGLEKSFLARKSSKAMTSRGLATFGTKDDKEFILQQFVQHHPELPADDAKAKVLTAYADGLHRYARKHNERFGSAFPITEAVSNVDESGAPHLHIEQVPLGHTASGKPSNTIDSALKACYPGVKMASNKLMAKYQNECDGMIIDAMNEALTDDLKLKEPFELQHTGRDGHMSMANLKLSVANSMAESAQALAESARSVAQSYSMQAQSASASASAVMVSASSFASSNSSALSASASSFLASNSSALSASASSAVASGSASVAVDASSVAVESARVSQAVMGLDEFFNLMGVTRQSNVDPFRHFGSVATSMMSVGADVTDSELSARNSVFRADSLTESLGNDIDVATPPEPSSAPSFAFDLSGALDGSLWDNSHRSSSASNSGVNVDDVDLTRHGGK